MPLEQIKTQVLLLHSQQSTLDALSTGFNDRYSVHCATSGTEALNTLGDTPIHVIVSAQDLPGMSGLDALREAKKRSPDTIAILLAGTDANDGLEALVGDKEVFQIVRGEISPDALENLIDSATKSVRLLALSEASNDTAANVDEPYADAEHIVMETAENGSVIISDGTGTVPVLKPNRIQVSPNAGGQAVDVLVLTKDEEFLNTIRESSRGMHNVHHAVTPSQAEDLMRGNSVGVLVTDAAMVGSNIEVLTQRLRTNSPRLVAIVAGRRDDGELLMDLINRGQVYRFLLKPVSPGRARLAIEASVKHHLEAADSAFKGKPGSAAIPGASPKPAPKPAPKPKSISKPAPVPAATSAPKPAAKPAPKPAVKPAARPAPTPAINQKPAATPPKKEPKTAAPRKAPATAHADTRKAPTIGTVPAPAPSQNEPSPIADGLDDAFDEANSFTETMTGIAISVGRSLTDAAESIKGKTAATPAGQETVEPAESGSGGILGKPKILAIAGAVALVGIASLWMFGGDDSQPTSPQTTAAESPPAATVAAATETPAPSKQREPEPAAPEPASTAQYDASLQQARDAMDNGDVYSPAGQNAIEFYLAAVDAAPGNAEIAAELDTVVAEVFSLAEIALLENRSTDASRALRVIGLADPENPRLAFLNAQLSQQQLRGFLDEARVAIRDGRFEDAGQSLAQAEATAGADSAEIDALADELANARSEQRLDDVLALAGQRLSEDRLTTPSNDNARYYFQLALNNDPGNPAAQQGLVAIASKMVLRARAAIDEGNFAAAESLLEDARALDPNSSELSAATDAIDNAKSQRAEQARIAADQQREAERLAAERRAADEREAEAERLRLAAEQRLADEQAAAAALASAAQTIASDSSSRPAVAAATTIAAETAGAPDTEAAEPAAIETVSISALERVSYVAPRYPRAAQRRNTSGHVDLAFTVTTSGTVADIEITESEPGTLFDEAAVEAVEQWRFNPAMEDGRAVEKRVAVRMSFALQ